MNGWNDRLKKVRVNKKITLKDASDIAVITQQALISYEKGSISPRLDIIIKLCDCYEISLNYVVYGNDIGLKFDNSLQKKMETFIPLLVNRKIDYDGNGTIKVFDDSLNKYLKIFKYFIDEYDMDDIKNISKLINAINKIKED